MAGTILTDSSNLLNRSFFRARFSIAAPAQRVDFVQVLLAVFCRIPGICGERIFKGSKRLVKYNRFVGPTPVMSWTRSCVRWLLGDLLIWNQQPYRNTGVNIYALSTCFTYSIHF